MSQKALFFKVFLTKSAGNSTNPPMLAESLKILRGEIEKARQKGGLSDSPVLLAASKGQPPERIIEAIRLGVTAFGENRVQEAHEKWPEIKKIHPQASLHLIGPLQTNKVKQALEVFDVIQTLDRPKLAEVLSAELGTKKFQHPTLVTQHFYIQVNTGDEPQKTGISPKDADNFIRYCKDELKLPVTGLMCIPPADEDPESHFAMLRDIAKQHGLPELSMGMSGDYITAIEMGATCIRIGTALFGERFK